ncbi:MAG: hypothetical protein RL211_2126 [Pseudomonadota bacterium]
MRLVLLSINRVVRCLGIDIFIGMKSRTPQNVYRSRDCANILCTRVHGLGFKPSIMNRFMHSNPHEVLFVT